jgi:hypothetical protein
MEVFFSLSIFVHPFDAWGLACGKIDVPRIPKVASDVVLPDLPQELLAYPVEVEAVWESAEGLTHVSGFLIAKDNLAARQIGTWLERERGLFAEPYSEDE